MGKYLKRLCKNKKVLLSILGIGIFVTERGIDVSGIENPTLAILLWSIGGGLILIVLVLALSGKLEMCVSKFISSFWVVKSKGDGEQKSKQPLQKLNETKLKNKLIQFRKHLINTANNLKKEEIDARKVKQALEDMENHDKSLIQARGFPSEHPDVATYIVLNNYEVGTEWLIQHDIKSSNLRDNIDSLKLNVEPKFKNLANEYIFNLEVAISQTLYNKYIDCIQQKTQRSFIPFALKQILFFELDELETKMSIYIN